ncbi:MAG: VanZ family protein [Pirellulales bacterium]|nr:VanZ family protein [Pirellulales bacterium]
MKLSTRWLLFLTLALVAALVVPLPKGGRWGGAAGDLLHAPVFAVFAVLLYRALREWRVPGAAVVAWAAMILFGAGTEVAQHLVGRNMSLGDLSADVAGATAGVLWELGRASRPARWPLAAAGGLLIALVSIRPVSQLVDIHRQRVEFPSIASFEHGPEMGRWQAWESRLSRARQHATAGQWSLRAELSPGKYPGVGMAWTPRDWAGHDTLVFDVHLDDGPALDFIVKIEDVASNLTTEDRFERRVRVEPGPNRIEIALSDVAAAPRTRTLDLRQIRFLQMFTIHLKQPRTIFLDNVRLE